MLTPSWPARGELQVVVWKWAAEPGADQSRVYTDEHVWKMASMLRRHLHVPYRLHVFTDDVTVNWHPDLEDVVSHPLPETRGWKHCRRLKVFDPLMGQLLAPRVACPRIVQLDLDLVIVDDVTPVFAPADSWPFMYSGNNISVMVFDAGQPAGLWDWYSRDPEGNLRSAQRWARHAGLSDQAVVNYWVHARSPLSGPAGDRARVASHAWSPLPPGVVRYPYRLGTVSWDPPEGARAVHMYGKASTNPGSPEVQAANPWILEHWK
jgi:hypothetical protein